MIPVTTKHSNIELIDPKTLSAPNPNTILPAALAKLNPLTIRAAVEEETPIAVQYSGRKKGATNRGNNETAPAQNIKVNLISLNNENSI